MILIALGDLLLTSWTIAINRLHLPRIGTFIKTISFSSRCHLRINLIEQSRRRRKCFQDNLFRVKYWLLSSEYIHLHTLCHSCILHTIVAYTDRLNKRRQWLQKRLSWQQPLHLRISGSEHHSTTWKRGTKEQATDNSARHSGWDFL